jgi:hypothetical protein
MPRQSVDHLGEPAGRGLLIVIEQDDDVPVGLANDAIPRSIDARMVLAHVTDAECACITRSSLDYRSSPIL